MSDTKWADSIPCPYVKLRNSIVVKQRVVKENSRSKMGSEDKTERKYSDNTCIVCNTKRNENSPAIASVCK